MSYLRTIWMESMKLRAPSRAAMSLTVGMILLAATTMFAQQLTGRRPGDSTTAKLVADMVARYHISHHKIDDAVSEQLLKRYLDQLDPQKLYFLQSDVDALQEYRHKLDDQVKAGDASFAYDTFKLYLERLGARIAEAQKLVDSDFDYTKDESMPTDYKEMPWAKSTAEVQERWRKRVKYDLLTLRIDGTEPDKARERLRKRYHNIQTMMEQTDRVDILEMFLTALTQTFDPHSSYMSPKTLEDFQIQMRLSLEGIGAALRMEDGYTVVASVVPGGAAAADGRLKVGDKVIGVGQETGEIVDVVEMRLDRVVRLIRGDKGTKVRLQVKKADSDETRTIELTRQTIELHDSEVRGEIINLKDRFDGPDVRVGVINIPSFYRDFEGARAGNGEFKSTSRDVRKVLADFEKQGGVDAVVVDLRFNGGGALAEAIEVTGLFINEGPVVQVKEQDGSVKEHEDTDAGVVCDKPLVVICNRLSASASEIFAGAIKDYGRGIIVGDTTTHGKGTVQNVMPVSRQLFRFLDGDQDRGALKLTINQFYRVNGDSTQNRGVPSDVVLPSEIDHMELGESYLDNALAFDQIDAAPHDAYGMTSGDVISALREASKQRIAKSEDFAKVKEDIDQYLARKERKSIPLNEEELRAERDSDKKDKDKDKTETDEDEPEDSRHGPIFPDKFYNNEVLHIAADYAGLLKHAKTASK